MSKATPENIWTVVPDRLLDSDRTLQFLVKERLQSKKSMENADIAIRDYMLKNLPVPSDDMLPGLTDGQRDVLDFIIGCYSGDGVAPTTREISISMGWKSQTSAVSAINALIRKGYLFKAAHQWRSLIPLFNTKRERIVRHYTKPDDAPTKQVQ